MYPKCLTKRVFYCIMKINPIESRRKEAALLRLNEYPAVNTNEFHPIADELPKLPAEHRPAPDEFIKTDPLRDESVREFAPVETAPAPPRRRPKKMLKYILGTVSIAAVVLTTAVESGQMSWNDLFPGQSGFIVPPDFTYPSYTYTIEEGNTYTISFDDTKLEEYCEFLAIAVDETSKGIPKSQVDEAIRLGSPKYISFSSAPEGCTIGYSTVGILRGSQISETEYTADRYFIDPFTFVSPAVWQPDDHNRITVSNLKGIITYGGTTAEGFPNVFNAPFGYNADYPFHRDDGLDIFVEIYTWGRTRSYDEILAEIRSNADRIEEKLISCYNIGEFTILDGSTDLLLPLFLKVDVTPDNPSSGQASSFRDSDPFLIPSYTYTIREGNSYRISFDEDKLDEYRKYTVDYLYRMTRNLTPERINEYKNGHNRFFTMYLDEPTGNITVAHTGGVMTSNIAFSSPFRFPIGKAWSEAEFAAGNPPPITILHNGQERTYGQRRVNGRPPVFRLDIDLREDAKSLGFPWYHLNYNSVDGVELEVLYEWGSDLTYSEIDEYIRQHADFSPDRSFNRPNRRTVEFTLLEGSLEIYIPTFLKIEIINP